MNLQPNAAHCFVCGVKNDAGLQMRFYETDETPARVFASYTVPARYQGYPGIVHGGIIAAMLDEVISRTIFRGDPPRLVVTAQLTIRYRRPVPVETKLRLAGWVERDSGKVIKVAGTIHNLNGALLAEAEGLLMEVDQNVIGPPQPQDWQLYPDETL